MLVNLALMAEISSRDQVKKNTQCGEKFYDGPKAVMD